MTAPKKKPIAGPTVVFRPIADLVLYAKNARTHSKAQIALVKASILEFGWTVPVLVDASGVVAGHARIAAAKSLYAEGKSLAFPDGSPIPAGAVPVLACDGWADSKRRAYILADNQLALNAGWDEALLADELTALLADDFDLALLGFDEREVDDILGVADPDKYTSKIEAPEYVPSGESPAVSTLFDDAKTRALRAAIDAAPDLPDDVRRFLGVAADRHTVFDFRLIADFYANAPAETQDLMEASALVIVDFRRAISEGFVTLTDRVKEQSALDGKKTFDDAGAESDAAVETAVADDGS